MSAPAIPKEDLRESIVTKARESKKPLTFEALRKLVKAAKEPFRTDLEAALNEKQLYRWPDRGRSQYFWYVSPEEKAREVILETAAERALSKPDLSKAAAKKLSGFPQKRVESEISTLLTEKQLQQVPAFASTSKLLILTGDGQAYCNAARAFVEKKIRGAGFDPAPMFTSASSPQVTQPEPTNPEPAKKEAAAQILEAILELEPHPGVPVSTARLREHLGDMTKHEFDSAALELRRKQEVLLSQHADPHNLSEKDKELLIGGQDGTYYVAISIR